MHERDKIASGSNVESKTTDSSAASRSPKSSEFDERATSQGSTPNTKPPAIPDYELLRRIGGGSYGDVWLARSATGVLRALKIVWRHTFEDDRPFQREFEGIQHFERLSREHPSQLALFHVGRNDAGGYFYYVMELADALERIDGLEDNGIGGEKPAQQSNNPTIRSSNPYQPHTLRADLEHGRLPAARVLEIGLALTEALSRLHTNGLVHRDVKPSNVIFVNGRPKLADIGLVTDASDRCSIVGTEGYLPPEGPGTPQADIFALGKVLYEALTGLDRREFPKLPEDLRDWPDAAQVFEVNEVILKGCESDRCRRYASAEEMLADLQLLQQGSSVKRKRAAQQWLSVSRKAGFVVSLLAMVAALSLLLLHRLSDPYLHSSVPGVEELVKQGIQSVRRGTPEYTRAGLGWISEAIEKDTNFVPAYFALFAARVIQGGAESDASTDLRRELRAAATNLMQRFPEFAESHAAASMVMWIDWRFPEARAVALKATQMRAASQLGEAAAHVYYGWFLLESGNPGKALEHYKITRSLVPESHIGEHHLGHPYFVNRDFEQALQHYRKSLELEHQQGAAHYFIAQVYEEQTNFMAAIEKYEEGDRVVGRMNAERRDFYDALRKAVSEDPAKGYWLQRLELELHDPKPDPYYLATLYARLGDWDNAYVKLEEAIRRKSFNSGLMFDLCWNHKDPRFIKFATDIGLMY